MNKATVIIPTTGAPGVEYAIRSVLEQTEPTDCYVVTDGMENFSRTAGLVLDNKFNEHPNFKSCTIHDNVGANGFYGHRVYAAFPHLVNTEYVSFLDQDNWFEQDHIKECLDAIGGNQWVYSLRNIVDESGEFQCRDDCESLGKWLSFQGYNLVDTNSYFIRRDILIKICQVFHGGWGQDRVFYSNLSHHFPHFECTGKYTVNYRMGGGTNKVTPEFFKRGNEIMKARVGDTLPWSNE